MGADPGRRGHPLFAALYDRMAPVLEGGPVGERRRALLAAAAGTVLEIGAGTGQNLPFLPPAAGPVVLAEPDPAMRRRLRRRLEREGRAGVRVEPWPAEAVALPDASVDTVVATLALCTVDDPARALAEVRRVLRPGGRLLFMEHVRAAGGRGRGQDLLAPLWRRFAGGCRLNRDTLASIRAAGLAVEELRTVDEGPEPWIARPVLLGRAVRPAAAPAGAGPTMAG